MAHKFLGNTKSKHMNHAGQSMVESHAHIHHYSKAGKALKEVYDKQNERPANKGGSGLHPDRYGPEKYKDPAEKNMSDPFKKAYKESDRLEKEQKARADKNDKYEGRHHTK